MLSELIVHEPRAVHRLDHGERKTTESNRGLHPLEIAIASTSVGGKDTCTTNPAISDARAYLEGGEADDLSLDCLGHYLRGMLDLLRADNVPQRALLDVLDRILPPVPLDHWRIDQSDSTRRRHGIGATVFATYSRVVERSLLGQLASRWFIGVTEQVA